MVTLVRESLGAQDVSGCHRHDGEADAIGAAEKVGVLLIRSGIDEDKAMVTTQFRGRVALVSLLLCLTLSNYGQAANGQTKQIILDGQSKGRVFEGLGALSAGASSRLLIDYPEPQRSEILDYLFKPAYGAALQHLKVEVGGDVNSTDGSEPSHMRTRDDRNFTRGYEWWLIVEAHKRNPDIVFDILPWGAPAWVSGKNRLYTRDMAEYMATFIEGARDKYALNIRYAGIWNESLHDAEYVKELKRALKRHDLDVKVVCCDEADGKGQWAIADEMLTDGELNQAVDVIGVHYPLDEQAKVTTTQTARDSGKPLWSSEDQPNSGGGPIVPRTWIVGGRILAHVYNRNYIEGGMTKTEIWSPITAYYDNLAAPNSGLMYANTPWSGSYDVQSTIWVTAHTTQFAQPGWQYLDSASGYLPQKGTYVSLKSQNHRDWSVVLETIGARQVQQVNFSITGGLAAGKIHIWETNANRIFEHVADVDAKGGRFTFIFDPESIYSLTTTTGQAKGTAQPPSPAPFPLPYKEDFEQTLPGHAPKYLADQDGAFEVRPCAGRPGKCLEQVISQKPIPWGPLPDPFTLTGDAGWSDYTVSVDVHFLTSAPAVVMGRIDSADVFQDGKARWPSGYILRLKPDGNWALLDVQFKKPAVTLVSGVAKIDNAQWHRLGLRFHGQQIDATLDGTVLATIENSSHSHGMFALGTEWDHIQFDNLEVAKE